MAYTGTSYSVTGLESLYTTFTNNTSQTNKDFGNLFMNQYTLELAHAFPALFSEQTFTLQTYPNQQFYQLPLQIRKINTVVINVGNTGSGTPTTVTGAGFNWPVQECPTMEYWNVLNMTNNITSDIPLYYIYYNGQLGIYPKPAAGYNPITIRGQIEVAAITQADYTTGTISAVPYAQTLTGAPAAGATSATLNSAWTLPTNTYQMIFSDGENILVTLTNGSTAVTWSEELADTVTTAVTIRTSGGGDIVTGSGTTWTSAMVGYGFNIKQPTGDGYWYTIGTFYNTTTIALLTSYGGNAITAGSSTYTIGQVSIVPPAYQLLPVYRATERYYGVIKKDKDLRKQYKEDGDNLFAQLKFDMGNKDTDPTVQDDFGTPIVNPNLAINTTQST